MTWLKDYYGYFYLAFIALATWLLVNLTEVDPTGNKFIPPHSPNIFSHGYTKWEMGTTGIANTKLFADKISHFSDDHTTDMEQPVIIFYQEKQSPWVIKSESGKVSADKKNVFLKGHVVIDRAAFENAKPLKITTSNLKVKPDIYFAETDERAELLSQPNKTTGTGMKLTFKQPINIGLFSHVQGKYETK